MFSDGVWHKSQANEDTIVADTNVSQFAREHNICCGHKFCVRDTKNRLTKLFSIDTMFTDLEALTLLNCFSFSWRSKIRWAGYFDVYTFETSTVHSVDFLLSKPFSFLKLLSSCDGFFFASSCII